MSQIALVTGADRGLGLALTAALLERGWQTVAGQYMPDWPDLAKLAERYPDQLIIIPLDVASDDSVWAAASLAAAHVDRVDVLINNAGVNSPTSYIPLEEPQDFGEMQRLYNVNSLGPLRVVNAFLSLMEAGDMILPVAIHDRCSLPRDGVWSARHRRTDRARAHATQCRVLAGKLCARRGKPVSLLRADRL